MTPGLFRRQPLRDFLAALGFLTTVPVPRAPPGEIGWPRAAPWFPVVGLGIGAALAGAHHVLGEVFPPLLASALLVSLWAILTGGLHLEGLADSLDGLFAPVPPGRRLEILRDPRLGAFGVIGLSLFLVLKVTAVASLPPAPLLPLLLAPALGRWLVLLLGRYPRARPAGLAVELSRGLGGRAVLLGFAAPLALIVLDFARGGRGAVLSLGAGLAVAWGTGLLARRRLGGITGDVLGLAVEAGELAVLLVHAAAFSREAIR